MSPISQENNSLSVQATFVVKEIKENQQAKQQTTPAKTMVLLSPFQLLKQATIALRQQNDEFAALLKRKTDPLAWGRRELLEIENHAEKESENPLQTLERTLLPLLFEEALYRALSASHSETEVGGVEAFGAVAREDAALRNNRVSEVLREVAEIFLQTERDAGRTAAEVVAACIASAVVAERNLASFLECLPGGNTGKLPFVATFASKIGGQAQRLSGRLQNISSLEQKGSALWGESASLLQRRMSAREQTEEESNFHLALFLHATFASQIAMYQLLTTLALKANDPDTEQFALMLKQQKKELLKELQNFFFTAAHKVVEKTAS